MSNEQFLKDSSNFFAGAFELINDDAPDGAWFQMHVDMADSLIDLCCEDLKLSRPEDIDGFDVATYYLENK
jgi:hypothetical protein